jgi:hypothetical protein
MENQARLQAGSPTERLVGSSFSVSELRYLFGCEEFRAAVDEMKTVEEAEKVIELGAKLLTAKDYKTSSPSNFRN